MQQCPLERLPRAAYRMSVVTGWHWRDTSGGVGRRSPRPFLHVYVACEAAVRALLRSAIGPGTRLVS